MKSKEKTIKLKEKTMKSKDKALFIANIALEKKGEDIVMLNMTKISSICDYFVILSAPSNTRMNAISEAIGKELSKIGEKVRHREGIRDDKWVLVDATDVIVHIFHTETRKFYDLERLWNNVPQKNFGSGV
ncbi:MAG: ribosome silencing factor [Candidatus Omnitrophica bacterium]|nr:ribosome silencing factor [Candidatus Omnitrophota bacterium]